MTSNLNKNWFCYLYENDKGALITNKTKIDNTLIHLGMEEKKDLARQLCPTLRFHKKEEYTPTNFMELFKNEKGEIDYKCSMPRRKWKRKAKFDPQTKLKWFASTAFVHFLEDLNIEIHFKKLRVPFIIQYLYYHAYNDYFWGELRIPFLMHQHDWEIIQIALVKLDSSDKYEILSYSISAHGTFMGIDDHQQIEFFKKTGFRFNRGAHNFGSIFYLPNPPRKDDLVIAPNTLVPTLSGDKIPFKESLTFLDELDRKFLNKFSFAPLIAPWKREFYNSATWIPEFWSWSLDRQLKQLISLFGKTV